MYAAMFPRRFIFGATVGILCLVGSCITRDNPWDPINGCPPEEIAEYQTSYQNAVTPIINKMPVYLNTYAHVCDTFDAVRRENSTTAQSNQILGDSIAQIAAVNRERLIKDSLSGDCKTATPLDSINLTLRQLRFVPAGTIAQITTTSQQLAADSASIDSILRETANHCPSQQIITSGYRATVLSPYRDLLSQWEQLSDSINLHTAATGIANHAIDSINGMVRHNDSLVEPYNNYLDSCKIPRVSDPDSIKEIIDSLQPGDTLAFDKGTYSIQIFLQYKGRDDGDYITIMGTLDGSTIIDSSVRVELEGSHRIRFEHLTFNRTQVARGGVRIWGNNSDIHFRHCTFSNNNNYGIEASGVSNLIFEDCRFLNNGSSITDSLDRQAGIRIQNCTGVTLSNILVARNNGFGIEMDDAQVYLDNATISDNLLYGLKYSSGSQTGSFCTIANSIFSYNGSFGIFCNNEGSNVIVPAASNNRFFLNAAGEMGGDETMVNANKPFTSTEDPLYSDRDNGDYHIGIGSPLYTGRTGYQYP